MGTIFAGLRPLMFKVPGLLFKIKRAVKGY